MLIKLVIKIKCVVAKMSNTEHSLVFHVSMETGKIIF